MKPYLISSVNDKLPILIVNVKKEKSVGVTNF